MNRYKVTLNEPRRSETIEADAVEFGSHGYVSFIKWVYPKNIFKKARAEIVVSYRHDMCLIIKKI